MDARRSTPAILAIIAAVISLFFAGAIWGFLLAIGAILLGIVGFLMAASPRVSGGIMSIIAIGMGVIGIVASVFKAVI
jgi:hypothetical protein